jgi:ABC-type lipoprotein release transport system permease subunit
LEIVGVAGHVRTEAVRQPGGVPALFLFYTPSPAARSAPIATRAGSRTGPSWSFVQLTIRLSSPERAEQVFRAARAMAPTFEMEGRLVDDVYAEYESDTRLMARIIAAFGLLAFAIAIAGVYGVMAFLVAGRRREIGIRITIGADRGDIANLILGSSMRLTLAGAAVGGAGAIAAARLIQSQLYGIAPTDPITYLVVIALVTAAAVLATLHPLRQAWRMDPAITLRAE